MRKSPIFTVVLPILAIFLVTACSRGRISSVAREDLFTMEIGPLDNQINLFDLVNTTSSHSTNLVMRDGFFYISDPLGKKIVHYNSYGALLFVIYNEETNPPPITLSHNIEDEGVATRWSIAYPLREPGAIAVDSRKQLYTADKVADDKKAFDEENQSLLDTVVLRFDKDGQFINYLGQEGVGGKPFPAVKGIYSCADDELAVVCILSTGWNIYWFNSEGTLLYLVRLPRDSVPASPTGEPLVPTIDSIAPAPDTRKLFLKADYYKPEEKTAPNGDKYIEGVPHSSVIWIMNAENGAFEDSMNVPFFEYTTTENNQKVTQTLPYFMLGVIKNERVFLYFPVDSGYSLLVLTAGSHDQRLGFIQVRNDELEFNTFNLSAEGILSGLVATNWEARLVWWRTDKLLGEMNL
jgi:hypothetical protein